MKVFFDHQIFSMQMYGGISRYFANLSYDVNSQNGFETKVGLLFTENAYLNNNELPAHALKTVVKRQKRRFKYNSWYCKYLLMQNNFDVFHPTYYYPYFLSSLKKPFVLTVHDMINELFPQYFATDPVTKYKAVLINRADHIIAISESTKNDIQKFFDVDDKKISVIHLGNHVQANPGSPNTVAIDNQYLLFVGDRFGYKNFELFLKAVAPVLLKHAIKLICAGGGNFKPYEVELIDNLNVANKVQQLSVSDEQLAHLYKNAIAFVYPSLYEGFGLPILEAFANNCPLIVSNTSSLPEVAGEAAEYFNPAEKESITFAIEKVVNNKTLQQELRVKGVERVKLFSFENCVQQTLQVYSSLT
jgi:glycosyltransferase involved in cell wall biosynthesis